MLIKGLARNGDGMTHEKADIRHQYSQMEVFSFSVSQMRSSKRSSLSIILLAFGLCGLGVARGQEAAAASAAPSGLVRPIDEHALITLRGNVRGI